MKHSDSDPSVAEEIRSAERMKFFTDAVIAIAMTLLILPLLDSVSESAALHEQAAQWLSEHHAQLFSLALSFVIIANFWLGHHSLYTHIRSLAPGMLVLNLVWMFVIVWLPVATAIVGSMETDRTQIALYVGAMFVATIASVAINVVVRRHPATWEPDAPPSWHELSSSLAHCIIFAVVLVLALASSRIAYKALFLLLLTPALESLIHRRLASNEP